MKKIKIAFITEGNAKDVHNWSGTIYNISKTLEEQGFELYYIDNLKKAINKKYLYIEKIKKLFSIVLSRKNYLTNRSFNICKEYARIIEKQLQTDTDLIIAPSGNHLLAFVNTTIPKMIWNDATFRTILNYYPNYSNLSNKLANEIDTIEKISFDNCDLLLFSSEWAANSCINDYKIDKRKVKTIPFGANIDSNRTESNIKEMIDKRLNNDTCNLLFIGVDWIRKGGDIAVEITKELNNRNIKVHLDVVGIKDKIKELPDYITNYGFISKSLAEGKNKIDSLFSNSNFLVLPTMNECYGIVFVEASSFGLPIITTNTGGVGTAVIDNVNGMKFALNTSIKEYADYIERTFLDVDKYKTLCLSAFKEYKEHLNWAIAGETIKKSINELLKL